MTIPIADLATTDRLLVVVDFDGTLADLSPDIYAIPVNYEACAALARLAGLPDTVVTVLSGRHIAGLTQVCPLRAPVNLAGSHGAESDHGGAVLTEDMRTHLAHIENQLAPVIASHPKAGLEIKPFQRVVHVAEIAQEDPAAADELLERAVEIDHGGAQITRGKNVVEFSAVQVTKGTFITAEYSRHEATRTIFIGDDVTDEHGFRALREGDVGVKVGEGDTAATERIPDTAAVAGLLTGLADARATHTGIPRDLAQRFRAVAAGFTAEVVRAHDWSAPTPCEEWAARDIVAHLTQWYPDSLREADIDLGLRHDARRSPAAAWDELVTAVQELLDDPVRGARQLPSGPHAGQSVAELTARLFVPDVFMHTWDLARSQGNEVALDEDFARRTLTGLRSLGEQLRQGGQFGPARPVSDQAPAGERLMAHVGRDPGFGLRY